MLDIEFPQLLQDMIGDLTSAPEPIEIKLFSQDPALLREWAPKVADAIKKIPGVVDVLNGIENTISGPAIVFQVDPGGGRPRRLHAAGSGTGRQRHPARRARPHAGRGERPLLHHPRALPRADPRLARRHPQHAAGQFHRQDRHARLARRRSPKSPAKPKSAARICSAMWPSPRASKA